MATENILQATKRTEFGKGAARRARRAGLIPAVMYGGDTEATHLDLPGHETFLIVRSQKNALITLKVDGEDQLALVKDVQVNAVTRQILHLDLLAVKAGEKVEVDVPLEVVGEPAPGAVHTVEEFTISVKAPATAIPESIVADITGLEIGTVVRASDLKVGDDVEVMLDPEQDIINITEPAKEEPEPEAAPAEGAEGEAAPAAEESDSEE